MRVNKQKNIALRQVGKAFGAVGFMGFGGGSANIPIIEKQTVTNHKMLNTDEFTEQVVVCNITPGAFPVKMGQGIGNMHAGISGGLLGSFFATLPGAIISIVIVSLLTLFSKTFLTQLSFFSVGISAFIILLMMSYVKKIVNDSKSYQFKIPTIAIIIGAFMLSFGGKIRQFIDLCFGSNLADGFILFQLDTLSLLFICFFIIFFNNGKINIIKLPITIIVSLFYAISAGKNGWLPYYVQWIVAGVMAMICIINAIICHKNNSCKEFINKPTLNKSLLKIALYSSGIFMSIIAIIFMIALLSDFSNAKNLIVYCYNATLVVLTSFGGGAAFYPMAESIFVDSGLVSQEVFVSQLMPIVNATPGPALVKMMACLGFEMGFAINQNFVIGYLYALLGLAISVGVSSGIFAIVLAFYKSFSSYPIFTQIKKWILPMICGLLFTTTLSLINANIINCHLASLPSWLGLGVSTVIYSAIYFAKKTKVWEFLLIILSGFASLIIINLLALAF